VTTIRDMYQYNGGASKGSQKNSAGIKDGAAAGQKTTINDMYKYQKKVTK